MSTLADRVWYAIHCLPRGEGGKVPTYVSIEQAGGLDNAVLSKIVRGKKMEPRSRTMEALAQALHVERAWLEHGAGQHPTLTGPLPPRPGSGAANAWRPTRYNAPTTVAIDDPYATRAPVIAALVASGENEAVIMAVQAERHAGGDPGIQNEKYWWERIKYYRKLINQYIEQPALESVLDHVPGEGES